MGALPISPECTICVPQKGSKILHSNAFYSRFTRTDNIRWTRHSPREMWCLLPNVSSVTSLFLNKNVPLPHHVLVFPFS